MVSSLVPSQYRTRILRRGDSRDPTSLYPGEVPLVILRVQVLSCQDLEAIDRNGYSDPFVTVSVLGYRFKTPVCKRNLNPVYEPKDATFEFPIYTSRVHQLGTLMFVVSDTSDTYLGEYSLTIDHWFKGTAFAFNDPNNQPFSNGLVSSRPTTTVRGTICIKLGFVHPPNSTGLPDFGRIYNALMNTVLAPADKDHVGVVMLEICGAKDLPKWSSMFRMGWDMDPFVQVSIGEQVARTRVVRHSLNPVWDDQLLFHVREQDLSLPIRLTVFDRDKIAPNDTIGHAEIMIATLIERVGKKDISTALHPDYIPTIYNFELPLTMNPRRVYKIIPTITFRAGYQPYDTLRNQVGQRA